MVDSRRTDMDSLDTPLYKTAEDGQVEEVERLIKARRNVDKAGSR